MILRACVLTPAVLLSLMGPVSAKGPADAAAKWGFIGTWAPDCAKKPSRDNTYLIYERKSEDRLIHKREFGDDSDQNDVLETKFTTEGNLEVVIYYKSLNPPHKRRIVFVKMTDGQLRAIENQVVGSSDFSVKDGKLVSSGQPVVIQYKCR